MNTKSSTQILTEKLSPQFVNKLDKALIGLLLGLSIYTTIIGLIQQIPFWEWAWARHQNLLSWVVRPLFIPMLAYFSYRKSKIGIFVTFIGIISSMYWFIIPANPNPDVINFLQQEQDYLLEEWNFGKLLWSSLVPLTLGAMIFAFWQRSIKGGLIVINLIAFLKITWSLVEDPNSGWILIPFAILGLVITNIIIIGVAKSRGISILGK